jgi:uncharacterized membrane protein
VRMVDVAELVSGAREHDVTVQLIVRPGDHVITGTPVALAWHRTGRDPRDPDAVRDMVRNAVELGYERTVEQHAAFEFRQFEDIAVKALSPGINDPVTAAHAIGYMADLLVQIIGCRHRPTVQETSDRTARAIAPDRDVAYYLELSCGQVRRYGRHEPTVLVALPRVLRDAAALAPTTTNDRRSLRRYSASWTPRTRRCSTRSGIVDRYGRPRPRRPRRTRDGGLHRPIRRDAIHLKQNTGCSSRLAGGIRARVSGHSGPRGGSQ